MSLKNILGSFQPKTTTDTEQTNVLTVDDPNYTTETEAPKVSNEQQDDTTEDIFRKIGYTKEDVDSWNTPSQEPVLSRLYKKTVTEPTPISEKGIKASRAYGSLGDSIGLLADVFGASRGAHVAARDVNGATNQANMELAARERNKAQVKEYQSGLLNAEASDAQSEYARKAQLRSQMQQALYRLRDYQLKLYALGYRGQDLQQKAEQFKAKLKQDANALNETVRSHKANENNERQKAETKQNKTNADMELVTKVRSLPVEWQKKMGFLKPVSTEDFLGKKTEWTFDNSIRPDILEAAVKEYNSQITRQKQQPQPSTNKYLEVGTKKTDSNTAPWKK